MTSSEAKLFPLRIRLPYATEEEFIEKYGSNVARGGVFVATRALKPEGTGLAFEFVLADGTRLLRGEGTVIKAQVDEGGTRSGMTVRFVRLDVQSKALVERVVVKRSGLAGAAPAPLRSAQDEASGEGPSTRERSGLDLPSPASRVAAGPRTSSPAASPARSPPAPARAPDSSGEVLPSGGWGPALRGEAHASTPGATSPVGDAQPGGAQAPEAMRPSQSGARSAASTREVQPGAGGSSGEGQTQRDGARAAPSGSEAQPAGARASAAPARASLTAARGAAETRAEAPEPRARRRTTLEMPVVAARPPASSDEVLGIDLGFGHARVAVFHQGSVRLVPPRGASEGAALLSLVALNGSGALVARHAADPLSEGQRRLALPLSLGLRAQPQRLGPGALAPPLAMDAEGDIALEVAGRAMSLSEVGALLLAELKSHTAAFLGHEVRSAVLCVPAHFNSRQRAAMREAGTRADLRVLRLLSTPAAAALTFGHGRGLARKRVLVVDLGGGLDASVMQITGDDVEVIATGGSPGQDEGEAPEQLAASAAALARSVLEAGGLTAQGLDEVLLVDSRGRADEVRPLLEAALGASVRADLDAVGAGALGAALVGDAVMQAEAGKAKLTVSEVLSLPLGLGEREGTLRRIFERNTRLPAEKSLAIELPAGTTPLALFQGAALAAVENEFLGCIELVTERPGEAQVHCGLGADGLLALEATLPGGRRTGLPLLARGMTAADLAPILGKSPLVSSAEAPPPGKLLTGLRRLFGRR